MSVEINLSRRVEVFPEGVRAISLSFRGDLSKVDYAGADARLAAEMDRLGLPHDMSDYVCVYPSDPSAYAVEGGCDEAIVDICITLPHGFAYVPSSGFGLTRVAGGRYLVFSMTGPYSQIPQAYCEMYSRLLPEAYLTYQPDAARPMMERYVGDPAKVSQDELITEFWHPIM